MPFQFWQQIPPSTPVKELYKTSLLACTDDLRSGILLRCGSGLGDGDATIIHASTRRPNALKMTGVDDDAQIVAQAQALLATDQAHVVAIPHITWKSMGNGLRHRTLISIVVTVLAAVLTYIPPLSLSPWVAVPAGTVLGLLTWLVLRERNSTTVGPPESPEIRVDAVVKHVRLCLGDSSHMDPGNAHLRKGAQPWPPPIR